MSKSSRILSVSKVVFLGIIAVITAVGTIWTLSSGFSFAGLPTEPTNVKISNITDNSATVSFQTQKAVIGSVIYSTDIVNLDKVVATPENENVHYFVLKNLIPDTQYYVQVGSAGKFYGDKGQKNSKFHIKTGSIFTTPPTPDEMYGKVKNLEKKAAAKVVVAATIITKSGNSSLLSALTNDSGNFSLDLGNARTADTLQSFSYSKTDDQIKLDIQGGTQGEVIALLKTNQTQPVPEIALGQGEQIDLSGQGLTTQQKESQDTRSKNQVADTQVQEILKPTVSQQEIKNAVEKIKPKIILDPKKIINPGDSLSGTASPGATLTIEIHSTPVTLTVTADANGKWQIVIPPNLEPGTHSVVISDANGTDQSNFVLAAEATPTLTPTPTLISTLQPLATATIIVTPSAVRQQPTLPQAGNSTGLIIIAIGILGLFIFSFIY